LTVKTDVLAITPTATATKAFSAAGSSFSMLLSALQQHAIEMQALVKQLIAYHPTDQVLSATVHAGGSGGTNGVVTITGTTGTGVKFTANGTIAGGALTGAQDREPRFLHHPANDIDCRACNWRRTHRRTSQPHHDRRLHQSHGAQQHSQ
jgi:hypothetical protein